MMRISRSWAIPDRIADPICKVIRLPAKWLNRLADRLHDAMMPDYRCHHWDHKLIDPAGINSAEEPPQERHN